MRTYIYIYTYIGRAGKCVCVICSYILYLYITRGRRASEGGDDDVGMWVERERIEWVCPSVGLIHIYLYMYTVLLKGCPGGLSTNSWRTRLQHASPERGCLPPPYRNPSRYTRCSRAAAAAAAQSTVEFIAVTNGCHHCRLPIISGASGFTDKCISGN